MCDPDILLIYPPFHMRAGGGNFIPLGLGYIISAVKNSGFSAEIINCAEQCRSLYAEELTEFEIYLTKEIQKYKPMLIGIGPCITSHVRALKIVSNVCKNVFPGIPVVCGGPLATMKDQEWFFFEELGIPSIIRGDGEKAIPSLIKTIKMGLPPSSCPEVSHEGHIVFNEISDINSLYFPYRADNNRCDQISKRRTSIETVNVTMPMITSRGCINSCDYCVSGNISTHYRKRSNENIINEMLSLRDCFGVNDIVFYDDCFFTNPKESSSDIEEFCYLLLKREVAMTWQIELRTDLLLGLTDTSVKLLERAGCRQINIGIEKTSDEALATIGKASSVGGIDAKNKHISEISQIKLAATFILGGDNESETSVMQLIMDSKKLSLSQAHYNPLFVYPATKLYAKCGFKNREWYNLIINDTLPWGEVVYESKELPREKLLYLIDKAYTEFYRDLPSNECDTYSDRFNIRR